MIVRPCATFTADFPDDQIEDGTNIIQFGGCNVAEALAEILRQMGGTTSGPEYAGDHGWEFDVDIESRALWCQVTSLHPEMLIEFKALSWADRFMRRHNPVYIEALKKLNSALIADPRFDQIQWFAVGPNGDMDDEGFKDPVSET